MIWPFEAGAKFNMSLISLVKNGIAKGYVSCSENSTCCCSIASPFATSLSRSSGVESRGFFGAGGLKKLSRVRGRFDMIEAYAVQVLELYDEDVTMAVTALNVCRQ